VGHGCVAWTRTKLGVPEVQDVFVREDRRRRGIGEELMRAIERVVSERGHERVSISYGIENTAASNLYAKLGYRGAGVEPQRVVGTIMVRSGPLDVDDTLIYLVKQMPVDLEPSRSS
jgi:GNAT superfamily N-acetyltransferase